MSRRRDPDDEEIDSLLADLESTLDALRNELRREERAERTDHGRRDDRRPRQSPRRAPRRPGEYGDGFPRPPRPPSVRDLLRFTNDYTIPTVIATLEATIEALELLRGVLRLAGGNVPDGRVSSRRGERSRLSDGFAEGLSDAGERAASDATDALSTLRRMLAEADLPEEGESRDLIDEVRELSAELDRRIAESSEAADHERDRERRTDRGRSRRSEDDGAVVIDVTDGDADEEDEDEAEDDTPEVDVDAELDSIKRELGREEDEGAEGDGAADGSDDAGSRRGADDGSDAAGSED